MNDQVAIDEGPLGEGAIPVSGIEAGRRGSHKERE